MNVGKVRQVGRVYLHYRPDHDERPIGPGCRHIAQEHQVHPLVDDTEISKTRAWNVFQIGRHIARTTRLLKMLRIHCGGKQVDIIMTAPPGFMQAATTGEHHVCQSEQLLFQPFQPAVGEIERG